MQRAFHSIFFATLPLATISCLLPLSTQAQITPDGTTATTINQDGNDFVIDEGDRVGDNLFHSFNEFSVPTLGSAVFNNGGDIANIFSRVTGGSISSIDGLLGANGAANLFLINPNGIVFGQNARLDLGGSFFASTADSLLFEGDAEFSAVDPQAAPLLEVSIPIGARFRDNPSPITIEQQPPGSADFDPAPSFDDNLFGLRVPDGKSFALAGGDITANGGGIVSVGGRIELGAVGKEGILGLDVNGDNISFNFPDDLSRADVSLTNNAGFLVSGSGGGDLVISANNISISEGSGLFGGIFNGLGSPNAQAGDITLNAADSITISNSSSIQNSANTGTIGNAGNISITASSLSLNNTAQISTETFSSGNAGNLTIDTGRLLVSEGAFISTATRPNSSGLGGNLIVKASEFVELSGTSDNEQSPSGLYSTALGTGNGGELNITTPQLIVKDGARAETSTNNQGSAGNLIVNASNSVELIGTSINGQLFSRLNSETFGSGDAGDIKINTQRFQVQNLASLSTSALGVETGNAGNISVVASDFVNIDRGTLSAISGAINLEGNLAIGTAAGGNIRIESGQLNLQNGSNIITSTLGEGNAGTLTIDATDFVNLDSSRLFTASIGGSGGDISVKTKNLSTQNNSSISTLAVAQGNPGNLSIEASDAVNISASSISTSSFGIGSGGSLSINTENLTVSNSGEISTSIIDIGTFNVEDLNLNGLGFANAAVIVDLIVLPEDSEFEQGNSGNINILADSLLITNGGTISASTLSQGNAGDLSIKSNRIEFNGGENGFLTGLFASVEPGATGEGGNILVGNEQFPIQQLILGNGAQIVANTFGEGDAGNLSVFASNIDINGSGDFFSGLFAEVGENATGQGGNINIGSEQFIVEQLSLSNGAIISASTFETGNGGNIFVRAESLLLERGGRIASNVNIGGQGNGGDVEIVATDSIAIDGKASEGFPSAITSVVNGEREGEGIGIGNAGNVTVTTNHLSLTNSGRVSATTLGQGNAGNLTINAADSIFISGFSERFRSGIVVNALVNEGNGGNAKISTNQLTIQNGGTIEASDFDSLGIFSEGAGERGNISIEANSINLNNEGRIEAATQFAEADSANINLTVSKDIILQNNSFISARALKNATGGNVNINANDGFILAFPNQDNNIIANASEGLGGAIDITTEAIFGLEVRPNNPITNDIDATSGVDGLDGTVDINNPAVDPTTGLINLPASVGDASDQISQNPCQQGVGSQFIVTGKGGLPPTVNESLNSESARVDLIEPVEERLGDRETGRGGDNTTTAPEAVPAQGWVFNDKGEVTLTAYKTTDAEIKRSLQRVSNSCSTQIDK